jgi:hypothetical protein
LNRQQRAVARLEDRIQALLSAHIAAERPQAPDWPLSFIPISFHLARSAQYIRVRGLWTSGYLGDEGEEESIRVPVQVLAPLFAKLRPQCDRLRASTRGQHPR